MATLYEYWNTGDNLQASLYGTTWIAQTFTPSVEHKITSVKLLIFREGSPGTLTVSIRETNAETGYPTGGDLCSGTINGNNLDESPPEIWPEISLGDGYNLDADTKYAIVVRALNGSSNNEVKWRYDNTGEYAGGWFIYSVNSGSDWDGYVDYDLMFEDWGEPAVTEKTSSDTGSGAGTLVLVVFCKFSSDVGYCGEVLEG